MYKLELLDLFTNQNMKEYFTFSQIEKFDSRLPPITFILSYFLEVNFITLDVEYQYYDEERNLLIFSDECYNQHEVPGYLFKGNRESIQPGARFTVLLDGERYIKVI